MNDLQIFTYNETPLRTVERDGELWWVLKDVCAFFGVSNHHDVGSRLDDDEKGEVEVADPMGRKQKMRTVNESGLYSALFSMQPHQARGVPDELIEQRKQQLKDFKRWVTHEVLPSIRKTGSYAVQPMSPAQLIAAQAQILVDMEERMNKVEGQALALEEKVDTAIKAFARPAEDHWKSDMDKAIKQLCSAQHWSPTATKGRMYAELEEKANCNVNARLSALRRRKKKNGARHKDAMALNKLDAIAQDKQLRAIFESIVRTEQARAVPTREGEPV